MCGTHLYSYFIKYIACWKQTVTHTFKTGLATCWYRWEVWRRLKYQLMQVITRVPTSTSENASEISSSPNYNSCRQIILRVAKSIRLKELKHDYPKKDGYKKTQHCITSLFFYLEVQRVKWIRRPKTGISRLGRLDPWEWAVPFFETLGTTGPETQRHIPEDRNPRILFSPKSTEK